MLMKLFQLIVFTSVIFSNIKYDWAHGTSPLAVSVVALAAAWIATAIPFAIIDLSNKFKSVLLRCHQGIKNRRLTRT
jgi:hypothetical protein